MNTQRMMKTSQNNIFTKIFGPLIELKNQNLSELKPYLSIFIIITFLFSIVFLKMEIRRIGYADLKLSRDEKRTRDQSRGQMIALEKVTRPDRLQKVAESRLTLRKAESGQIIQMSDVSYISNISNVLKQ